MSTAAAVDLPANEQLRAMIRHTLRLLTFLAVFFGSIVFIGVPALEHHFTFRPRAATYEWRAPSGAEDVFFDSAPGVKLHAWYWRADKERPAPVTVLYAHGNAGHVQRFSPAAAHIASLGFDVLLYDYRGYGRSEGKSEDEKTLFADGRAAMEYLVRARGVPAESIAHYGYSLGSAVSAELAVSQPCRAAILVAPLASVSAQVSAMYPWVPEPFHALTRSRFDTVGKIGRARCPVMVVHGDRDQIISVEQGRAVYEAAREPKRLMIIPGATHWLGRSDSSHLEAAAQFIRTSPSSPPAPAMSR
ncbi:MAG: alpha/beta fold hydrolase [Alphaproteobacteria bacterium]|nr:alpha/beta fold hydrolase [Alphaproteobacteria bacterium]MCW5744366.1 alpha/beta fold hydrolase [Alphaproteobacteria bacterium]